MTGLGLVIARFYEELAAAIETEARERVRASDAEHVETMSVPGAVLNRCKALEFTV